MIMREASRLAADIRSNIEKVIVGKQEVVDLMLTALFASGHVLIEDVPGTGKTLLARTLAKSIDCTFRRLQFTPDLLPSDVTGIHYFNPKTSDFEFRPGPAFANVLLADEINRATPRTQASLLECMEERQISLDGVTRTLERPFLVLATQNPADNQGTFPLPEAQLDRFLMKIRLGYPSFDEGIEVLKRFMSDEPLASVQPVTNAQTLANLQDAYKLVRVHDELLAYMLRIVEETRKHPDVVLGVSPRGSQALLRASMVHAMLNEREYILPDDIKAVAVPVLAHRLMVRIRYNEESGAQERIVASILERLPVPTEEGIV